MNDNEDSDDSQDSGSEASSRGALLQARGGRAGSKQDGRGKNKRKTKTMVPMVWFKYGFIITVFMIYTEHLKESRI